MRIAIAIENLPLGAAEAYALSLANGLAALGHNLLVLVPAEGGAEVTSVLDSNLEILTLPLAPHRRFKAALPFFFRWRPDVVHVNQAASPVQVAARLAGVPVRVLTDHMLPIHPHYNLRGSLLAAAARRATNALVVFSEQNARAARATWRGTHSIVIYPGVAQPSCQDGRATVRERLGILPKEIVACTIGRLSKEKRHDLFIRAVSQARRQNAQVRGIVVGAGQEYDALSQLISELDLEGIVQLIGHRNDIGCVLGACDLYVQCSIREGLGFALLEAMAARLPMVVSDLPSFREVLASTSTPFVPLRDDSEFSTEICALAASPVARDQLASELYERWKNQFTIGRMVRDHADLYQRLSGTGSRIYRLRSS